MSALVGRNGACSPQQAAFGQADPNECPHYAKTIDIPFAAGALTGSAEATFPRDMRVDGMLSTFTASLATPGNTASVSVEQGGLKIADGVEFDAYNVQGAHSPRFTAAVKRSDKLKITTTLALAEAAATTHRITFWGCASNGCCD